MTDSKKIKQVLSQMIKQFNKIHQELMDKMKKTGNENYASLSHFDGETTFRLAFVKIGADYNNPTKEDLSKALQLIEKLFKSMISEMKKAQKEIENLGKLIEKI